MGKGQDEVTGLELIGTVTLGMADKLEESQKRIGVLEAYVDSLINQRDLAYTQGYANGYTARDILCLGRCREESIGRVKA